MTRFKFSNIRGAAHPKKPRIAGKPPDEERKTLYVSLTLKQYAWVCDESKRKNRSLSHVVRSCIVHTANCGKLRENVFPSEASPEPSPENSSEPSD